LADRSQKLIITHKIETPLKTHIPFVNNGCPLKNRCERLSFLMPPRPPKKAAHDRLESEVSEMESIMAMLRGQIDEERAKVQPNRTRWAAAADGPITKFDSHGELARKILSKKKPCSSAQNAAPASPRRPALPVEVTVEPQGGRLWGQYADSSLQPESDESAGGSLWGEHPNEEVNAPGGALWGPPPDELEEQMKFQREVSRLRGEPPPIARIESEDQGVGGTIVETRKKVPTGFTYFDFLVTRDILDGSSYFETMMLKK
jgi:hypothetical protein